jgi:hypothetical protein
MKGGFREGLPTVLGELQRVSVDELSDALNNAIDKFIVPASLREPSRQHPARYTECAPRRTDLVWFYR